MQFIAVLQVETLNEHMVIVPAETDAVVCGPIDITPGSTLHSTVNRLVTPVL
jgi:hypothetical protein